jgi:hypothetical protein
MFMADRKRRGIGAHSIFEPLERRALLAFTGNILVAAPEDNNPSVIDLRTYSQTGQFLSSVPMPSIPGADGSARDIVVGPGNWLDVFAGTFSPQLATQSTPGGAFTAHTTPGWSVVNRTFYGGIAAIDNYVFVTDMLTANDGNAQGVVRFDKGNNFAAKRFSADVDTCDVTIGLDGKLYAMVSPPGQPMSGQVRVYDPTTLALLKTVNLSDFDDAAVTADAAGNIYTGAFGGTLRKLSPTGQLLKSAPISATDLDIAADGTILAVSGGTVYLLDSNLNLLMSFTAPSFTGADFAAFDTYQPPVPQQPGSITGHVFNDTNGNAGQDSGEANLSGWTVFLDTNNNGVQDSGDVVTATGSNGNYTFANLKAGTYHVVMKTPNGWRRTLPSGSSSTYSYTVTVQPARVSGGRNFAFQKLASIVCHFFDDANEDLVEDAREPNLAGWTAFVDINKNGVYDAGIDLTSITGPLGKLTISNLLAGTYRVIPNAQTGWKRTTPASVPVTITVAAGGTATVQFGEALGEIGGSVYKDANANGVRDPSESGFVGVTMYLDMNNDHTFDSGDIETTTDAAGFYTFVGLKPGTYHVNFKLPAGKTRTSPNANGYTFEISAGQLVTGKNFGIR